MESSEAHLPAAADWMLATDPERFRARLRAVERHMIGFQQAYKRRGTELESGERLALGSRAGT
jgi:hypothetical protein